MLISQLRPNFCTVLDSEFYVNYVQIKLGKKDMELPPLKCGLLKQCQLILMTCTLVDPYMIKD